MRMVPRSCHVALEGHQRAKFSFRGSRTNRSPQRLGRRVRALRERRACAREPRLTITGASHSGTIVVTFTAGAVLGAVLTLRASRWAMIAPSIAIFAASAFAFYQRTMERTTEPPRPR